MVKDIKLTKSQQEGAEKIIKWLKKPASEGINGRVFRLTGKAGTGKTTLLKYALRDLIKEVDSTSAVPNFNDGYDIFSDPSIIGVAMAHKAKTVLSKSIPKSVTFASYFGLKISYKPNGEIEFIDSPSKHNLVTPECEVPYEVAVHDEISMYDKKMGDIVFKKTNPFTKIIIMGDPGQLPPVNEDGTDLDSPMFNFNLDNSSQHHLEERVRQTEGNPIIELSDIVYNQIFTNQNINEVLDFFRKDKIENNIGYQLKTYGQFLETYKESSDNYMDSKVIAYKNKQVNIINQVARKFIHNNPDFAFIEGECIYMTDNYSYVPKGARRAKWTCYNSDEYLIKSISRTKINKVDCYNLFIDPKGHKQLIGIKDPFINVVSEVGSPEFERTSYLRKKYALEAENKDKGKKWRYYYQYVNEFGKVSYGYCFTGYKAQGSTYKTIFIDVNDILTTGAITNKRKLQALYTAITRASHRVVFLKK